MEKMNGLEQNVVKEASDAELEQVNGGIFNGNKQSIVLNDLLFRKDEDDEGDIVLLPMDPRKRRKKTTMGKKVNL